jgi:hypothetical protein
MPIHTVSLLTECGLDRAEPVNAGSPWDAVVAFLAADPDKVYRLLVTHINDGRGRCRECSARCQTGVPWPCTLRRQAVDAAWLLDTRSPLEV